MYQNVCSILLVSSGKDNHVLLSILFYSRYKYKSTISRFHFTLVIIKNNMIKPLYHYGFSRSSMLQILSLTVFPQNHDLHAHFDRSRRTNLSYNRFADRTITTHKRLRFRIKLLPKLPASTKHKIQKLLSLTVADLLQRVF